MRAKSGKYWVIWEKNLCDKRADMEMARKKLSEKIYCAWTYTNLGKAFKKAALKMWVKLDTEYLYILFSRFVSYVLLIYISFLGKVFKLLQNFFEEEF